MEIVKTDKLTKEYGIGEGKVIALDHVSFSVNEGELVSILGPSGSGKSTLLHLLGGVDKPTSGAVYIGGESLYDMNDRERAVFRRRRIGLIYQFYNLIPVLNVEENICLPLLLDGRSIDREYLEELIVMLGLEDRRKHLPGELSGGQQQRVSIGRALISRPEIILADEPTGNLDINNTREIIEYFKRLNEKYNQTIILITHDISIASETERVLMVSDGRISKDIYRNVVSRKRPEKNS